MDEVIGQLSKEQYYKWRLYVEYMQHAETRCKLQGARVATHNMEAECHRLKHELMKNSLSDLQAEYNRSKDEYQKQREELEKELGFKMENCVVDEITLEVKKLEDSKPKQ